MTRYFLLRQQTDRPNGWSLVGDVEATSAQAAIRKKAQEPIFVDTDESHGGTYIAVPARSWQPISVEAQEVTRVRIVVRTPEEAPVLP